MKARNKKLQYKYLANIDKLVNDILDGRPIENTFGVKYRTFMRYRQVAYQRIENYANTIRTKQLEIAIARLNTLYLQAEKVRDKLQVQIEINKLLGLSNTEKIIKINMSEQLIESKISGLSINDIDEELHAEWSKPCKGVF